MQDTAPKTPSPLAPGRYTVFNGKTYTRQIWEVTPQGVTAYTVPSGPYEAARLGELSAAEASEALSLGALTLGASPVLDFTPSAAPSIGNPHAANLHRELGRLGFRDHYAAASDALGREVGSLAALSEAEARTVRSYARGAWGLSA